MNNRQYIGAGLLTAVAAGVFIQHEPGTSPPVNAASVQPAAPANAINVSIANTSTKQLWMRRAVTDFNRRSLSDESLQVNGKPIRVEDIEEIVDGKKSDYRSGTMVADTLSGKIKPTVLSPGDESWISVLKREWHSIHRKGRDNGPGAGAGAHPAGHGDVAITRARAAMLAEGGAELYLGAHPRPVHQRRGLEAVRPARLAQAQVGIRLCGQIEFRDLEHGAHVHDRRQKDRRPERR